MIGLTLKVVVSTFSQPAISSGLEYFFGRHVCNNYGTPIWLACQNCFWALYFNQYLAFPP